MDARRVLCVTMVLALAGCGGGGGGDGTPPAEELGSIAFTLDVSGEPEHDCAVTAAHVTLTRQDSGEVKEADLAVNTILEEATGTIAGLALGTWDCLVEIFQDATQVARATGAIAVPSDAPVAITMADLDVVCLLPTEIPSSFTQRALFERLTSSSCSPCLAADTTMEQLLDDHPDVLLAACMHANWPAPPDPLLIPEFASYRAALASPGLLPSAAINRVPDAAEIFHLSNEWSGLVDASLAATATCGVRVESTVDVDNALVTVRCGFLSLPANPVRLTVLLIEDGIAGTQSGTPYVHDHVVRDFLTAIMGDEIDPGALQTGVEYTWDTVYPIPTEYDRANLKIVAFVNEYNATGSDVTGKLVLNVNTAALGATGTW